jgi:hypothetical protein
VGGGGEVKMCFNFYFFFTSKRLCLTEYITPIFTLNDPPKKKFTLNVV